jgi:hypothetical protein
VKNRFQSLPFKCNLQRYTTVAKIRDELLEETGEMFDCALLNLYPVGAAHVDSP